MRQEAFSMQLVIEIPTEELREVAELPPYYEGCGSL